MIRGGIVKRAGRWNEESTMGDVLPFKKPKASEKHRGNTLCQTGFHKWRVDKAKQFDVKLGKLVTCYVCERCGATKVDSH